jgi:hypothetical protein
MSWRTVLASESKHQEFLDKHGIKEVSVGLGFSEEEQKWYGWSHRATCGFGIGDMPKEPLPDGDAAPKKKIENMQEAEEAAKNFVEAVSSQKAIRMEVLSSLSLISQEVDTLEAPPIEKPYATTRTDYKGNQHFYDEAGRYHNTSGPAFIGYDGSQTYYRHGKEHNEKGPAFVHADGSVSYALNGQRLTQDEFERSRKSSLWREVLSWDTDYHKGMQLIIPTGRGKKTITVEGNKTYWGYNDEGSIMNIAQGLHYPNADFSFIISCLVDIVPQSVWNKVARTFDDPELADWDGLKHLDEMMDDSNIQQLLSLVVSNPKAKKQIQGTFLAEALGARGVVV